ncbi:MAG: MATE family efflux transporter [Lachnospiraceae bacterium]
MMVSSAGEAAVSAVSLVDNVFVLLINLFAALATGGAVISGQYLGRRRPDVASESSRAADPVHRRVSVLIMALTYFFRSFILNVVFEKSRQT